MATESASSIAPIFRHKEAKMRSMSRLAVMVRPISPSLRSISAEAASVTFDSSS
ncbi:MAG: hypothetical protein WDN69_28185 [Aliidongia sp.]